MEVETTTATENTDNTVKTITASIPNNAVHSAISTTETINATDEKDDGIPIAFQNLQTTLEQLLESCKTHTDRFAIMNHIYGCIVILESLTDTSTHLTVDNLLLTPEGSYNLYENFATIGHKHGFSKADALALPNATTDFRASPNSSTYRDAWLDVFEFVVIEGRKTENIDTIEDDIFTLLDEYCAEEKFIFDEASETGQITSETLAKMDEMMKQLPQKTQEPPSSENAPDAKIVSAPVSKPHKVFRYTRRLHGRRSLTPMRHHRNYSRTVRKRVNVMRQSPEITKTA